MDSSAHTTVLATSSQHAFLQQEFTESPQQELTAQSPGYEHLQSAPQAQFPSVNNNLLITDEDGGISQSITLAQERLLSWWKVKKIQLDSVDTVPLCTLCSKDGVLQSSCLCPPMHKECWTIRQKGQMDMCVGCNSLLDSLRIIDTFLSVSIIVLCSTLVSVTILTHLFPASSLNVIIGVLCVSNVLGTRSCPSRLTILVGMGGFYSLMSFIIRKRLRMQLLNDRQLAKKQA